MLALDLRILLALLTTSSRFVSLRGCSPACVVVLFFIDICDFLLIADASGCGLEVVLNVSKLTYILYHSANCLTKAAFSCLPLLFLCCICLDRLFSSCTTRSK